MTSATTDLRREADRIGLTWTAGYQLEGRCTDTDTVTTLWPVPGDASQSLTFEEWDGRLTTDDELTVAQAIGAVRRAKAAPVIVTDGSTDGATGRCECGVCGGAISPWDRYCKHCGSEVDG